MILPRSFRFLLSIQALFLGLISCTKDPAISMDGKMPQSSELTFRIPAGWPAPAYSFQNNPVNPVVIQLGKKLFNDPALSRDSTVSCAFCHQPAAGFANAQHIVSHGIGGQVGTRNSPSLFNLAWHPLLMWDGGANNLETQALIPLQSSIEMDLTAREMVDRLAASPEYQQLFKQAFGTPEVNLSRTLKAMAQFATTIISDDAKWDRVQRGAASFTAPERAGESIFQQRCASCHKPPLFSDFSFRNNGLHPSAINDSGRAHITHDAGDLYKFKVPSLRNLAFSAPYFHDGRTPFLEMAISHYTDTLTRRTLPGTDPLLQQGIPLSATEKTNLLAFLRTLNDTSFVQNRLLQ